MTVDGRSLAVNYGLDSLDHVNTITYPSNRVVTYSPDSLGRPASVAPYVTAVSYHPSGQVGGMGYANGVTAAVTFNARMWPSNYTATKGTALVNRTYGYDVAGNLTSITDTTDSTGNRTLGYDAIDRLTSAAGSWGTGTLAYDGDGDITSQVLGSFSLSYGYDTSNRLSSVSGSKGYTFTYDVYGDVTSNGISTFTYDDAPVLRCANCATTPIQYTYDGRNMQVKTVKGALTNYSLYAANGDLLGIYDSAGAPIKEYAYLSGKLVAMYTASGAVANVLSRRPGRLPGGGDQPDRRGPVAGELSPVRRAPGGPGRRHEHAVVCGQGAGRHHGPELLRCAILRSGHRTVHGRGPCGVRRRQPAQLQSLRLREQQSIQVH